MYNGVEGELIIVDPEISSAMFDDLPLHVHLVQRRSSNLMKQHTVGVDEEQFLVGIEACRYLARDSLRPAKQIHQPKCGRKLAAKDLFPFS